MNKLIYLFELDSMRNTSEEVRHAQHCMFYEIVENGNQIVLTYNQITDSHGFLVMLLHDESYELLIQFIQKGYIKFSQYRTPQGIVASPVQYMRQSLKKPNFCFTALPVNLEEKQEMNEALYTALTNVDGSSLEEYASVTTQKGAFLLKFVTMLTLLSLENSAVNPPKTISPQGHPFLTLWDVFLQVDKYFSQETPRTLTTSGKNLLLENAESLQGSSSKGKGHHKEKSATQSLKSGVAEELIILLPAGLALVSLGEKRITNKNSRSDWQIFLQSPEAEAEMKALLAMQQDNATPEMILSLAECLIDLCYNYGVESSISAVSPHYQWDNKENAIQYSLISDFSFRILIYWNDFCLEHHRCLEKKTDDLFSYEKELLAPWSMGIELLPTTPSSCSGEPYAKNKADFESQKKLWKKVITKTYFRDWCGSLFFILFFCVFEYLLDAVINPFLEECFSEIIAMFTQESGIDLELPTNNMMGFIFSAVSTLVSVAFFALLASYASAFLKVPDLLDTLHSFIRKTKSFFVIYRKKRSVYQITLEENERKDKL